MTITLFSNIPNPYNEAFIAKLRADGSRVRAVYKSFPDAQGRHWQANLGADDIVTGSLLAESREWRAAADTDVILSGSYATGLDMLRRVSLSRRAASLHVWGERLRDNGRSVNTIRRGYFAPWRLDGILAVGARAAKSYKGVTGGDTPIHTFPYTTDRGLDMDPIPSPEATIGYAGRLVQYKGLDVAIRALALMAAKDRPQLEIAGSGPKESAWRALAATLGLVDHIVWLGELTPDELDVARSRWWAQLVPSQTSEGWGVVVHEAMNAAVPVIASNHVNAAAELVKTGINGTVIAANATSAPATWASAMAAAGSPGIRKQYGASARVTGRAVSPAKAAPWLVDVLAEARRCRAGLGARPADRSFIDDALIGLGDPAQHGAPP